MGIDYLLFWSWWWWGVLFQEVSEAAAEALVNLSQNSNLAEEMVKLKLVETTMDVLYKPECCVTRLLVMLLVNLTQLDAGTDSLLQVCFCFLYTFESNLDRSFNSIGKYKMSEVLEVIKITVCCNYNYI